MSQHDRQLFLKWLLRLVGLVEMLAFIAVIMPHSWMEASHAWLGLGQMPEGPVLKFLTRQASYTYGMHGISLWVLSWDVQRFRPLILLNGISFLLSGPVFFIIYYNAGMPMWWTVEDSVSCALVGVALLWLSRKQKPDGEAGPHGTGSGSDRMQSSSST